MHRHSGLSLTELLFVASIITIMASLTLPGQRSLWYQHQGAARLTTLASLINNARSEAIRQHSIVTICPSADLRYCGGSWEQGVLVFLDPTRQRQPLDEAAILRVQQWPADQGNLRWRAFGNRQFLHIDAIGQLRHQSGNFTWCPPDGSAHQARQLIVSSTGRMRLSEGLDANNRPIQC